MISINAKADACLATDTRVFPIYWSEAAGAYRNVFGERTVKELLDAGEYEFGLLESPNEVFTILRLDGKKAPNALHTKVRCPYHEEEFLKVIDDRRYVCKDCDPRLGLL